MPSASTISIRRSLGRCQACRSAERAPTGGRCAISISTVAPTTSMNTPRSNSRTLDRCNVARAAAGGRAQARLVRKGWRRTARRPTPGACRAAADRAAIQRQRMDAQLRFDPRGAADDVLQEQRRSPGSGRRRSRRPVRRGRAGRRTAKPASPAEAASASAPRAASDSPPAVSRRRGRAGRRCPSAAFCSRCWSGSGTLSGAGRKRRSSA